MTPVNARDEFGLTVAEFARQLSVTPRSIQQWEAGTRHPSATAQLLIDVLLVLHRRGLLEQITSEAASLRVSEKISS